MLCTHVDIFVIFLSKDYEANSLSDDLFGENIIV